jgi:hypothetical protein
MTLVATDVKKELTPEERNKLILAGVGPVTNQEFVSFGMYPHFKYLTGTMLRSLVDSGAVKLGSKSSDSILSDFIFPIRDDEKALAFLEEFPKFVAGGFIRNGKIAIHAIASEAKLTANEASAFKGLFGHADIEFWTSKTGIHASNSGYAYATLFAYARFDF